FSLSLVGALMALTVYALAKGWNLVTVSVNWLVASVAAAISSIGLLSILNLARITHIVNTPGASPYGLVLNVHDLVLGVFYSLMGLLTNLGANPAFDANVVRDAPHLAWARLSGVGGISFLINLVVLLFGIFAASQIIRRSLAHNRKKTVKLDPASRLSLTLIWTSLAAILIFILTNHYYAVDARYLGIVLFTLFVSLATYSRKRKWNVGTLAIINIVLLVSIGLGSAQALNTYHYDKKALDPISARNSLVIGALMHHHVNSLVGDYWRVIPTSQLMGKQSINFIPLADCFQPRDMLDSKAWNRDLSKASFAYLLSLDRSLTNYPQCSLDQVTGKYGRPNSSVLIAGTLDSPKELLLFYDHGTHLSSPQSTNKPLSTVLPIDLADLPYKSCSVPTIMNIVAHEDDDLLFLSPDLIHDIQAEHCIRTIYLTAGDGGNDQFYWLSRQRGSQAAYAEMIGLKNTTWVDRIVKLDNHQFITISNPKGNSKISLIFMHLPDGNLKGQGFSAQNYESLAKLDAHQISTIKSVDSQSFYSSEELISALKSFMHLYQPSEIRTQANSQGAVFTDHSDHRAVGRYVNQAYQQYETEQYENKTSIPISFYLSYPGRERPENIFDGDLVSKMEAFATYGKFDGAVCSSVELCTTNQIYNAYLRREYIESH
ncbi:MAG TPA: PIG-L family deacetylase, partial [Candidatus Saccharimonadales bacterium]|nr:PIG-L family deacetylase [Candidatus Saccharimonadales bacterium]